MYRVSHPKRTISRVEGRRDEWGNHFDETSIFVEKIRFFDEKIDFLIEKSVFDKKIDFFMKK